MTLTLYIPNFTLIPNLASDLVGISRFFEILDVLALEAVFPLAFQFHGTSTSEVTTIHHFNILTRGLFVSMQRKVARKRDAMASRQGSHECTY